MNAPTMFKLMLAGSLAIAVASTSSAMAQTTLGGAKTQQNKIGGVAKPAPAVGGAVVHTPTPPPPPKPVVNAVKPTSPSVTTHYAHLSSFDVQVGQHVERGQIVGRAGSTGRATSPHLHYELRLDGNPVHPFQPLAVDPTSDFFRMQATAYAPSMATTPATTAAPAPVNAPATSNVPKPPLKLLTIQ